MTCLCLTHFLNFRKSDAALKANLTPTDLNRPHLILDYTRQPCHFNPWSFIHLVNKWANPQVERKPLSVSLVAPTLWELPRSQMAHYAKYSHVFAGMSEFIQRCISASVHLSIIMEQNHISLEEWDNYCIRSGSSNSCGDSNETIPQIWHYFLLIHLQIILKVWSIKCQKIVNTHHNFLKL